MAKSTLKKSRSQAFSAQSGCCYYCGLFMWLYAPEELTEPFGISSGQAGRLQCTAEHLTPRSEGGRDTQDNIVAACAHCNQKRHKRPEPLSPEAYRALVCKRLKQRRWHSKEVVLAFGHRSP